MVSNKNQNSRLADSPIPRPVLPTQSLQSNPDNAQIFRTCEAFTKFLTSQGLSWSSIREPAFRDFLDYFDPSMILPTPSMLGKMTEKLSTPSRSSQFFQRTIGPLSVTMDVVEKENGDSFLAFSMHYFEGLADRKCVVFLRKLLLSKIDADSILICIRRAINNRNYPNTRITNFVLPNPKCSEIFKNDNVITQKYISFYHYLSDFVENVLKIEVFSTGLAKLREFIRFIKSDSDLYCKFRRGQLVKNEELNLPSIDDQKTWQSTATFLTKCLIMHASFTDFDVKNHLENYVSPKSFVHLSFLHQILQQCVNHARDLSKPLNSISQIIPAIMSMRDYLSESLSNGYTFEAEIRNEFSKAFQELTNGELSQHYDIATFLDPRYAFNESIYTKSTWNSIEKLILEVIPVNSEYTIDKVKVELVKYRRLCNTPATRPDERGSPFRWWSMTSGSLPSLALMARDCLACPATTIDARHFFGEGGKFTRICESGEIENLEEYLSCASFQQQYHGYGATMETIPSKAMALLHLTIARRRQADLSLLEEPDEPETKKQKILYPVKRFIPSIREEVKEEVPEPLLKEIKVETEEKEIKMEPEEPEKEIKEEPIWDTEEINQEPIENEKRVTVEGTWQIPMEDEYTRILSIVDYWKPRCCNAWGSRRSCKRRCALCGLLQYNEDVKNVTIGNEKTFLTIGSILSNNVDLPTAVLRHERFLIVKSYICRVHFNETAIEMMKELGVNRPEDIMSCAPERFMRIRNFMVAMRCSNVRFESVRVIIASLTSKYFIPTKATGTFVRPLPYTSKPEPTEPAEIAPKQERIPRKQIFESDRNSTIKVIEEEPFVLPDNSEFNEIEKTDQNLKCCYCLKTGSGMLRLPRSDSSLMKWEDKLGKDFMARLNPDETNYICRDHFSDESFSKRGRLLKGRLPIHEPKKVEVTYTVKGNRFVKVAQQEKGVASTVDLAARPKRKYIKKQEDYSEDYMGTVCSYCSMIEYRLDMLEVPKDQKTRDKWTEALGADWERCLRGEGTNWVCRKHLKRK